MASIKRREKNRRFFANQSRKQQGRRAAMNAVTVNVNSGLGGRQDRSIPMQPAIEIDPNPFYGKSRAEEARWAWYLYNTDWAVAKLIDIPVHDMFREGWVMRYTGKATNGAEIEQAIDDYEQRLGVVDVFQRACRMERIFGGAAVLIGVNSENDDTEKPLHPSMVDKGDLRFLNVLSRYYITKVDWCWTPTDPEYGRPEYYHVNGQKFHKSRLILFGNNPLSPNPHRDFMADCNNWDGMGVSVLAPLYDILQRANACSMGAMHLAAQANIWWATKKGLTDLQATRYGKNAIDKTREMIESMSAYRGVVTDEDLQIQQLSANFSGLSELMQTFYSLLAAAGDIPASRFFGSPPGGLSTDDRSGLENYYNNIASRQRLYLDKKLEQLEQYVLNSLFGRGVISHDDITREYKPLWNLSEAEKADIRSKDIQNVSTLLQTNILTEFEALEELDKREALLVKPVHDEDDPMDEFNQQMNQPDAPQGQPGAQGGAQPQAGGMQKPEQPPQQGAANAERPF